MTVRHNRTIQTTAETLASELRRQLHRSGARYRQERAWRFFEANNAEDRLECYRGQFSTLLGLMVDWRFEQETLGKMLKGVELEAALIQTQDELDAQAHKRVLSFLVRPCRKAVR